MGGYRKEGGGERVMGFKRMAYGTKLKACRPRRASFSFIFYFNRFRGESEGLGLRGHEEVKGEGGEGLKGMAELECQKRKGLQRLIQCFLIVDLNFVLI